MWPLTLALVFAASLLLNQAWSGGEAEAAGESRRITGSSEAIPSPAGGLELVWRRNVVQSTHEIWVRPVGEDPKARLLYSFGRDALVLWAPNGKMVAITDHSGTDQARVRVFRVFADRDPIEISRVAEEIERLLVDQEGRAIFGHSYAFAMRWLRDSRALRVELRGYEALDGSPRRLRKTIDVRVSTQ